jgi:hypothetical protein
MVYSSKFVYILLCYFFVMYHFSKPEHLFHSSKPVVSIEHILNDTGTIFWLIKLYFKS